MDHSVSPFPEAALAVSESLAEYNAKIQQINQSGRQLPHTSPASLDGIDADRSSQSLDLDPSGQALPPKKKNPRPHPSLSLSRSLSFSNQFARN